MDKLIIDGGRPLQGKVRISGAKNAALAILCAAIMAGDEVVLENIPDISDVRVMIEIIKHIGAEVKWLSNSSLKIMAPSRIAADPPCDLVKKLRASNLLLGPLLARFGYAKLSLPGGCNIGVRPMDLHFKGLAGMGAQISLESGYAVGKTAGRLQGARIYLDFPSVGATENIMMAACLAEGQTVLENVAKEPEIVDLANFLNCLGAKVRGAGTDVIKVEGVPELGGCVRYAVIPDRIESGTFMVAAAATRGHLVLENVIPLHVEPICAKLRESGVQVWEEDDMLTVDATGELRPVDIKTMPYPGFPTDMQSQMMAFLSTVQGTSIIIENIFENRFQIADELKRMGACIKVEGRMAVVEGVTKLHGARVKSTDLRAGAALVIAALMAEGQTEIENTHYIERGYHMLDEKLKSLGVRLKV
ncbi:UDP-N-acetylglucosamine 1-carboxyvinyltransferase [Desulfallas thermosapovorans]|uniref:UDP-N-acetylglucosamine 1-carboxyvinyltransferase n=1 Tax=Desulfallas thermosapovorans DSM 6562 TaxID=1121431 RepID=A0A5S4ZUU8_9FIRM|nr:UDP-N-acetylglucosamine 1-carboxyvinyltransferase [Desulfallas thermosapovorans]TYO96485.1 UDP-N-acetylglucosamine 1-carboxyvinyltransferase [Desulfallas thermosapovorans DSM 6562]